MVWELTDHFSDSCGELLHHILFGGHLGWFLRLRRLVRRKKRAVMIGDCVSRYLKNPALQLCFIAERIDPGMDFQKHVLKDVIGRGWVGDPLKNEKPQSPGE